MKTIFPSDPSGKGIGITGKINVAIIGVGISGTLVGPSAYFMKSPPTQYTDEQARTMTEAFVAGERLPSTDNHAVPVKSRAKKCLKGQQPILVS